MTVSAVRPWRIALPRERSLPSDVMGPVLLPALRRLAAICRSELIANPMVQLGSFRRLTRPGSLRGYPYLSPVQSLAIEVSVRPRPKDPILSAEGGSAARGARQCSSARCCVDPTILSHCRLDAVDDDVLGTGAR